MRILLTHVYSWPEVRRGGERYLHEAGAALAAAGHSVRILTTAAAPGRDAVLGVAVRRLPQRQRLRRYGELSVEACFGYEALARSLFSSVDVWHAFGTADGAAAARLGGWRPGVRSVYTDLGNPARWWRDERPDARLFSRLVNDVDEYLCLSSYSNGMLASNYGRVGRVVGGGVALSRFQVGTRAATPTLLFTANVEEPRKHLGLLLSAVGVLRVRGVPVRLVVAGPGNPSAALAVAPAAARDATSVVGVGSLSSLVELYGSAWVTVLPSVDEAFGLVLVESLACGTPVVALAEGGGSAELVTPGVGALAATATASDLADACEAALDLAATPGIASACREVAATHDWQTSVVPKLEAAYLGR